MTPLEQYEKGTGSIKTVVSDRNDLLGGADKSLARPGVNFLRSLVLQGGKKNLDDSSRLDVVEIARVA